MIKNLFIPVLLLTATCFSARAQTFETTTDRTGKKMLKGFVSDSILRADTASFGWFAENEKIYQPAANIVKAFTAQKDSVSYLAFFGTWCPDSHYVIPRFLKIIEQAGIDKQQVSLFALDRTKKDVAHFASNLKVLQVPTIIVLKNGKEAGRVVEYGTTGRFDEELAAIVSAAR
ncbi:MAG: thioredoxin family protein [Niabella sp.]